MPSPEEIVISVTAAAIAVSKDLTPDDTALWGTIFAQLGDTLSTIAVARQNAAAQQSAQTEQDSISTAKDQ